MYTKFSSACAFPTLFCCHQGVASITYNQLRKECVRPVCRASALKRRACLALSGAACMHQASRVLRLPFRPPELLAVGARTQRFIIHRLYGELMGREQVPQNYSKQLKEAANLVQISPPRLCSVMRDVIDKVWLAGKQISLSAAVRWLRRRLLSTSAPILILGEYPQIEFPYPCLGCWVISWLRSLSPLKQHLCTCANS